MVSEVQIGTVLKVSHAPQQEDAVYQHCFHNLTIQVTSVRAFFFFGPLWSFIKRIAELVKY